VEKYWNLQETYDRSISRNDQLTSASLMDTGFDGALAGSESAINVADEREAIVKDLLRVLGSISQVNMEPNGYSLVGLSSIVTRAALTELPDQQDPPDRLYVA
jgi:hypothetical protein